MKREAIKNQCGHGFYACLLRLKEAILAFSEMDNLHRVFALVDGFRHLFFGFNADRTTGMIVNSFAHLIISGGNRNAAISGNVWKGFPLSYSVTQSTMLEFTINASYSGEILAIALDDDGDPLNNQRSFAFGGEDVSGDTGWYWAMTPKYLDGTGDVVYEIPVGTYFTGAVTTLGLIGDDDNSGATSALFKNIRIYEPGGKNKMLDWIEYLGIDLGENDEPEEIVFPDGKPNFFYFAFDGQPGSMRHVVRMTEQLQLEDDIWRITVPVRVGATFSGHPLTSGPVDGLTYTILGELDLRAPWGDLVLEETTNPDNLSPLTDVDGVDGPDWEYRTFRVSDGESNPGKAFFIVEVDFAGN